MTQSSEWPRIAVVGAGAVGGYFGARLAQAGAPVVLIGRKDFVDAVNAHGLTIDRQGDAQRIAVEASTEMAAIRSAELVLFCVKSNDTVTTAKEMAPFLSPGASVISLQNGVDNVERVRDAAKIDMLPAAVYIAVSVPEPGRIKHLSRGDLVIGPENEQTRRVQTIFSRANIGCRITENIAGEMWTKLLCNCALNAISALGRVRYGDIAANADARQIMQRVVDELLAIARALGIKLAGVHDSESGLAAAIQIAEQMPGALSSTAQDLQRGKTTEIDALNGYIARRGRELGLDVPMNHALFTLVKLAERDFTATR
jgi:2-dehydropantoate 2-reductase